MDFLINSTFSTLTGLVVIVIWLFIGLVGISPWVATVSQPTVAQRRWMIMAIAGGVLTLLIGVFTHFVLVSPRLLRSGR